MKATRSLYEHEQGPADMSYDEYQRAQVAAGSIEPHLIGGVDFNTVGTTTDGGLGRAEHPGPGWRRRRWAELARRTGDPTAASRRRRKRAAGR
ncbi:hypothetical protein ACWCQL_15935 [Streptomyces sp. NPDC002073]